MASDSIREMLSTLAETGVTTNMAPQRGTVYTPRKVVTVNYCGTLNSSPSILRGEAPVQESVKVTFVRGQCKIKTIRNSIPENEIEDDAPLVFYKKGSAGTYRKLSNLEGDLKEVVKRAERTGGEAIIYVFTLDEDFEPRRQNTQDTGNEEEAGSPSDSVHLAIEDRNVDQVELNNEADHPLQNRRTDDVDQPNLSRSPLQNRLDISDLHPSYSEIGLNYQNEDVILDEDQQTHISIASRHDSMEFSGSFGQENEELPEIDVVSWKEISTVPDEEVIELSEVVEPDLTQLSSLVKEVQKRETGEITMSRNLEEEKHPSERTIYELLEKCILLDDHFKDFKNESKLSPELYTILNLISASEAAERTHIVTPEEMANIPNNISPCKPADDVKNILILSENENLSFVALVKRDDDSAYNVGEYSIETVVTFENSKNYMCNLIIKDVCTKININVNDNSTIYITFLGFNFGNEEALPFLSFLFLSARKQLGLNPQFSCDHLLAIVENVYERVRNLKTNSEHQPMEFDSEIDWFAINESNEKKIKLLESELKKND